MATWWYEWWRWLIMDKIWPSPWSWIIGTLLKSEDINLKPNDLRNALQTMMSIWILLKLTCSNQGKLSALLSCHPIRTGNEFGFEFELKLIKTIILNSPGIEVVLGKLLWETQVIVVRVRAQKLQRQIQSQSSCKLDIKSDQRLTNSSCLLTWIKNVPWRESWV